MKRSVIILLHVGFWLCFFALILAMLGFYFRDEVDIEERLGVAFEVIWYFAFIPSVICFYSYYFYIFPKFLQQKKYLLTFASGAAIALIAGSIGYTGLYITNSEACGGEDGNQVLIGVIIAMSVIGIISGIVGMMIRGFITWFNEIKIKEELQQKNHEMELALVKSQLDPHFLFNTINNIDVLILKDAEEASNYLNKLSDIMRFMLFETKTDKILLSKEIEYIKKYIALQKIRTSNSNYINFTIEGTANGHLVAPMVFIPFIENAFKHTNNKKIENAINIHIQIEDDFVKMDCENKFDPNRKLKQENNGLGNDLIKKRLNLIYQEQHELLVHNQNDKYTVNLTINNPH